MKAGSCLSLITHPVHGLATGFGLGFSPKAPGTVGTLLGFPLYYLIVALGIPVLVPVLLLACFVFGIWVCSTTGKLLGEADHPAIVWDEIVAMAAVLAFIPDTLGWQTMAFVVFRFFDIVKPWPIQYVDKTMKNGLGVMLDDGLAAVFTVALIRFMVEYQTGVFLSP
ncbi:MAG: phosphatidylglycerophosphatase A family protein [Methylococcaceae bacterium]